MECQPQKGRDLRLGGRRDVGRGRRGGGSYLPDGLRGAARRALLAPAEDNFRAGAREEREDGEGSGCGRAGRASSRLQKAGRRDARRRQRAAGPVAAERRSEATRTGRPRMTGRATVEDGRGNGKSRRGGRRLFYGRDRAEWHLGHPRGRSCGAGGPGRNCR